METPTTPTIDPMTLDADASLETVLAAWHTATIQLEQTHITLCEEVQRLTDELEQKNRELARQSRLADLGRMASHIAHEVRNNLMQVSLYMRLVRLYVLMVS
jgi:C4-dicarboxylate-specific signal transduction histidine kinase